MSYDVSLCDPVTNEVIEVPVKHFMFGGIMQLGGSNELYVNITYNYSKIIDPKFDESLIELGITPDENENYVYYLSGKKAIETIPVLEKTIEKLGNDVDDDYWKATEGNSKRALNILLTFAQMRPDGIWQCH